MVLYIHGGPESTWSDSWNYRWNAQAVAAQGYVVVAPNYHGSKSFGANFTRSILLDWGGKPFEDHMLAVERFASENSWVDRSRVGAMGASFGGFMVNWINGHTNGTFKCLISHDGAFDMVDKYYSTDELFFSEMEFGGPAYEERALQVYRKWSPAEYSSRFNTPELIFQGGKDFRIPDNNGIGAFTLLQRRGIPSKLVYFPSENHWVLNSNNLIFAAARPFTVHDLVGLNRVGTPASDGSSPLPERFQRWDEKANKKTQNLWLGSVNQTGLVRLAAQDKVSSLAPSKQQSMN
eukprot:m51a1_g13350 putative peptidase s9 (292) ;mRNA; r:21-2265